MLRARLLLTLFTSVFGTLALLAFDSRWHPAFRFFGTAVASLIAVSGLTVLIFTLFKARVAPDGSVCFSKNHPIHWLTIANLQDGTSLCATTWGTVIPIAMVSFASLVLFLFGIGIARAVQNGKLAENLGMLVIAGTALLVLAAVCSLIEQLIKKYASERLKKLLGNIVFGIVIMIFLALITVGVPIAIQEDAAKQGEHLTYGQSWLVLLTYFAYAIGSVAVVAGLVWTGFRVVPFLAKTGFGRFVKEELCPVVKTCPVGAKPGECTPTPESA